MARFFKSGKIVILRKAIVRQNGQKWPLLGLNVKNIQKKTRTLLEFLCAKNTLKEHPIFEKCQKWPLSELNVKVPNICEKRLENHIRKGFKNQVISFQLTKGDLLTLKMASAQVVETSVAKKSPSQGSSHPDDHFHSRYVTPGFNPFPYI